MPWCSRRAVAVPITSSRWGRCLPVRCLKTFTRRFSTQRRDSPCTVPIRPGSNAPIVIFTSAGSASAAGAPAASAGAPRASPIKTLETPRFIRFAPACLKFGCRSSPADARLLPRRSWRVREEWTKSPGGTSVVSTVSAEVPGTGDVGARVGRERAPGLGFIAGLITAALDPRAGFAIGATACLHYSTDKFGASKRTSGWDGTHTLKSKLDPFGPTCLRTRGSSRRVAGL